jgi:putative DNA primase/helicase
MDAKTIAHALRGRKHAGGWLVSCPCRNHGSGRGDRNPSLSVADGDGGRLLLTCFAGCSFENITAALRSRGLDARGSDRRSTFRPTTLWQPTKTIVEPDPVALEIWDRCEPIYNTIAEEYLQRRGITLTPPALCHYKGAMIAAVTQPSGAITAIQKTPINPDTLKRGDRWTKGPLGTGAVRLGAAQRMMGIAEGTETALSAMMLTGMSVWASLGKGRLHNVELPPFVESVHIFADNDDWDAARRAAQAQADLGRTVKIQRPPPEHKDFNDFIIADADAWQKDPFL